MDIPPEQFRALLPLACIWAESQEHLISQTGVPLTAAEIEDAKQIGVAQPEQVRLLSVDKIPLPENSDLRAVAEATQLLSPYAEGVTFRYGIFIRSRSWGERRLVVHELAHTAQYERLGGFQPFLQQYLMECLTVGYSASPLEQEAIRLAKEICRPLAWEEE